MRLLVTGAGGQVGTALARAARAAGHEVRARTRDALDITDAHAVATAVAEVAGGVVINAAAYTAVDRAESEEAQAFAINAAGPRNLAQACLRHGARLVHISTDYVFDGTKPIPWVEDDPIAPLGVYGRSKAEGERAVLAEQPEAVIVRASWVFAAEGTNFVKTILRLAGERPVLRVVADQRGCPTYAGDLAQALLALAARPRAQGLYHYCGEGETTWHGFAEAILAGVRARERIVASRVDPITTAEFPTPARRPANSVLDTGRIRALGITPRPWRAGLAEVLEALGA